VEMLPFNGEDLTGEGRSGEAPAVVFPASVVGRVRAVPTWNLHHRGATRYMRRCLPSQLPNCGN
jgi:hypothetical protein